MATCAGCGNRIGQFQGREKVEGSLFHPDCVPHQQPSHTSEHHFELLEALPERQQLLFAAEYNAVRRSPTVGVVLALGLGGLGAHRFYLREMVGVLYVLFVWTFIPSVIAFVEAFVMPDRVRAFNDAQAFEIKQKLGAVGSHRSTRQQWQCPFCAEDVLAEAKVCKHCHRDIVPLAQRGAD